ncbi:hypothetical protein [Pontiella sulfatireligans]|uniref:Uncharacterized protein n=1 Tax=Pontiella sulfatireligans TaxID=2750658 RepID=A0A6C2UWG9_9BACT|nr:hypothetical protein [Pontiella sulfatireligans]VGO23186.1 hypothetical protein SCARR_05291 [Pontiella sulfatireligans]
MKAALGIQNSKILIGKIRAIHIPEFFPEETSKALTAWNKKRADLSTEISVLGKSIFALVDEAASGQCTKPATVISDLQKARAKVKRYDIDLINLLSGKAPLWPLVQEAYKTESKRWRKVEADRNKELDNVVKDMVKAVAHNVRLMDTARIEAERNAIRMRALTQNDQNIVSNEEAQLLTDLKLSCQDL